MSSAAANVNVTSGVVSTEPSDGPPVIEVVGAVVSGTTVQVQVAGVGSALPTSSVATTDSVCTTAGPAPTSGTSTDSGDVHGSAGAPSSEQANVEPGSVAVNEIVAEVLVVVGAGPDTTVVSGGVTSTASTVHVATAGVGSDRPLVSVARTSRRWRPIETSETVRGELQGAKSASSELSTRHSNVSASGAVRLSAPLKVNVADVSNVGEAGPAGDRGGGRRRCHHGELDLLVLGRGARRVVDGADGEQVLADREILVRDRGVARGLGAVEPAHVPGHRLACDELEGGGRALRDRRAGRR